jgi:hypothetical protein
VVLKDGKIAFDFDPGGAGSASAREGDEEEAELAE